MEKTYLNPVYQHNFADPFVLKHRGEYWAYCTGVWADGRCFGVLRSRDLVRWQEIGGAMEPLPEPHPCYWAPEVTYHEGRFYLYYSVGDEATMRIRVAVADRPEGPFVDSGRDLTSETFAIDAHVFVAEDGAWHLFYATDFLEHSHIGTGTVRDRMLDPFTLAGSPTRVTLPRYDWQVYDPRRAEKGGVRWHTVEGPFVLERKRRFYQMFSGGNWQNPTYGVSYATADSVDQPGEWEQACDGDRVLPILRTIPGQVIGPGHNSVVRGPDNMQLYCVYHRWSPNGGGRELAIDPLDWAGERMLVLGPSTTPQPAPEPATFADSFDDERAGGLGPEWRCTGGRWSAGGGMARQELAAGAALARRPAPADVVVEVTARSLDPGAAGSYGLDFGGRMFALLAPAQRQLVVVTIDRDVGPKSARVPLPAGFDASAGHLLRVEINAGRAVVTLDEGARRWMLRLPADMTIDSVALATDRAAAAFAGFALTAGWQDLFAERGANPADLGWRSALGAGWRVENDQLVSAGEPGEAIVAKRLGYESYDLAINARLAEGHESGGYGFYPCYRAEAPGPLLAVERGGDGWVLACRAGERAETFGLPEFDPRAFQQFRLRKRGGRLAIAWEARALGEIAVPARADLLGLLARDGVAAFDMVRLIAAPPAVLDTRI